MPICHLYTNLKDSELKDGIEQRIAEVIADVLQKPIEKVTVVIIPGARFLRNQSSAAGCLLTISSIAVFDETRNPKYTPTILKFLQDELSLPKERITLTYHDLDKPMVGQ